MPRFHSLMILFLTCTLAPAAEWPQWLGPERNATSPEKVQPWKGSPRVLWRHAVGEGHSSPVVAGGKVFLHARVKDKDQEEVLALDARTGEQLWRASYARAPFGSPFGSGPRATPAVVDGLVYTFGVTGVLGCYKADSGDRVWQVDTLAQFKAPNLTFGVSSSPLLQEDKVLVEVGKGAAVVALDRHTGKVVWKALEDPASYSSPILLTQDKEKQAVFVTQQGVVSLDPETGRLFWKFPMVDALNESSTTPVRVQDYLVAGSVTFGSVALHLETKDGRPAESLAWKNPALTCYFSTPMAVKDRLYMVTGKFLPPAEATLRCVAVQTGKVLWSKGGVGRYHAALIHTGNDKLLMLEDKGDLVLLDPSAQSYQELARAHVCGETWAHPALAEGRLFIRDNKEVICLQLGEE